MDACERTSRGRLFLDNLGIDLETSSLSTGQLKAFGDGVQSLHYSPGGPRPAPGTEHYTATAATIIKDKSLFLQGPVSDVDIDEMVLITTMDDMVAHIWFDPSWSGGLGECPLPEDIVATLESIGDLSPVINPGATFQTGLPMVWLTLRSEIQHLNPQGKQMTRADAARDRLGLLSYLQDNLLCQVDIAGHELDADHVRRPTGFDGRFGLPYRSNARAELRGRTVDLSTGVQDTTEVVHPPIDLKGYHRFVPLGRVSYLPSFSWDMMADSVEPARMTLARDAMFGGPGAP